MTTRQPVLGLIVAFLAATASAAPPTTCGLTDSYGKALCAYQRRNFAEAEAGFRAIADSGTADNETIRAVYFLARTEMKRGRFDEASALLIRIYSLDRAFYDAWSCDFLLGECRRATGKE
jgi:TolA-binding protein